MESMTAVAAPAGRGEAAVPWRSVLAGFERRVAAHPEAQAVVPDGGTAWTYATWLDRCAADVATALGRAGAGPGGAVGVSARRTPEMVAAVLGVMRAGAAAVPPRPGRASVPPGRHGGQGRDPPGPRHRRGRGRPGSRSGPGHATGWGSWPAPAEARRRCRAAARPRGPRRRRLQVLYTSGSTGTPGVVMVNTATQKQPTSTGAVALSRVARPASGHWCAARRRSIFTLTCLLAPLVSGGCVELLAANGPAALLATLGRRPRYGVLKLTPSHLELLARGCHRRRCGAWPGPW